jgi:serine/threonine protein kinase
MSGSYTGDPSVSSHPYFCPDIEKTGPGPEAVRELIFTAVSSYVPVIRKDEILEGNTILGKGGAATVFSGTWRGRLVALKRFNIHMPSNSTALLTDDPKLLRRVTEAKTEMITMSSQYLQSQGNICRLLAIYFSATAEDPKSGLEPVLVMEQADMSLSNCIENEIFNSLVDRVSILRDLANGICAFHDVGLVHGDLKPENCLVFRRPDGTPLAKVTDFGCSKMFLNDTLSESYGGTKYWDAPECLEESPDDLKPFAMRTSRDVYSFGMIVIETIFDKHSLQKVGWRTSAEVYGIGNTPGLTKELEVEEMTVLKLNGGLASMGEQLFGARFDFSDIQLRFETHNGDGKIAVEPDDWTTLHEFDKIMSAGGKCEVVTHSPIQLFFVSQLMCFQNLKWKDVSVAEGLNRCQGLEFDVPIAFYFIRGLLERNPQQRVNSDELRILFK